MTRKASKLGMPLTGWSDLLRSRKILLLFVLVLIPLTNGPFLVLLYSLIKSILTGEGGTITFAEITWRRMGLFSASFLFSFLVAGSVLVIGSLAGFYLWNNKRTRFLLLAVLCFLLVPPFIHAQSWIFMVDRLNTVTMRIWGASLDFNGFWASWWVQTMALLPIGTALAYAAYETVGKELVEASLLVKTNAATFFRVIIPSSRWLLLAGAGLVWLLSITDFSIPVTFNTRVYALELFVEYSASGSVAKTFLLSWPVMLAALVVSASSVRLLAAHRTAGSDQARYFAGRLAMPLWFQLLALLGLVVLVGQILIPVLNLGVEALAAPNPLAILAAGLGEIKYTLAVAAVASLSCQPLAVLAAEYLISRGKASPLAWLIIIAPFLVPAPLTGIGLVYLYNNGLLANIYGTALIPLLAYISRFTAIATIIIYARLNSIDPLLADAARVFQRGWLHNWVSIRFPLMGRAVAASCLIVFALVAGELGATLIVIPPGQGTLTLKIYNYLHYGASDTVALLCLVMLAIACLASMAAYTLLQLAKSLNRSDHGA